MKANIPEVKEKRIVVIGGGFAGLKFARKLVKKNYQIVLIDRNNYHQFQPLFYQVATAGLEPSAISFPFRKIFQTRKNVFIRITNVTGIEPQMNRVITSIGHINYDYLVIATGAETNYFGKVQFEYNSFPMKSVSDALGIRNRILENYEKALLTEDKDERAALMNIAVVGGGPTGVELCGAIAEMKRFILPKDYPELDFKSMNIYLLEAGTQLLNGMSKKSSVKAYEFLMKFGVKVWLNSRVKDYDGHNIYLENGSRLSSYTMIWAAGVSGKRFDGISGSAYGRNNRLIVDSVNRVKGYSNIFSLGDACLQTDGNFPEGHPQVAQVAIQQAKKLAENLIRMDEGKPLKPFRYRDPGSMATIGRNLAVVDLPFWHFHGFFAWLVWMFVHLMSIVGVKNRLLIFINWLWNYFTYDQSLRLIIKPKMHENEVLEKESI